MFSYLYVVASDKAHTVYNSTFVKCVTDYFRNYTLKVQWPIDLALRMNVNEAVHFVLLSSLNFIDIRYRKFVPLSRQST